MSYDRLLEGLKREVDHLKELDIDDSGIDVSDPVTFVEKYVAHPRGKPQNEWFKDRPWLPALYRDQSKNLIIVKGRQMEMTEYLVNQLLYHSLKYPGVYIYATASLPKASFFSKYRLLKQIEASPKLKPLLSRYQMHTVEFGKSVIVIYSAFGDSRTLRSIPAEGLVLDEFQDIESDALGIAQQVLVHGELKRTWIVGTPLLTGSRYEEYWNDSTRQEFSREGTFWTPNPLKPDPLFTGYHISQEMALGLWLTPEYFTTMKIKLPKQQYDNEILGKFFSGLGRPLKYSDIYNLFNPLLEKNAYKKTDTLFAGVDWGVGKTARTVFWLVRPSFVAQPDIYSFDTLYIERIESNDLEFHISRIGKLIEETGVKAIACDIGAGYVQNQALYKKYGDRVMSVEFSPRSPDSPMEIIPSFYGNIIRVNRTWALDTTFDILTKPGRSRFYHEQDEGFKEFVAKDLLAEYPEVSERTGKKEWIHDPDTTDDALMAYTYSLLAFEAHKRSYSSSKPEDYIQFV